MGESGRADPARDRRDPLLAVERSLPPVDGEVGNDANRPSPDVTVVQLQRELSIVRAELAESERRFSNEWRTLQLVVLLANRASTDLWRAAPTDVVGKPCYQVRCGSGKPCPGCPAEHALRRGVPAGMVLGDAPGQERPHQWEVTSYPLRDEHGRVVRVINFATNLTRRRWQRALTLRAARLSAVGELAAGIAHEINNPLSAIIGNAQMLLRDFDDSHSAWPALQTIERAGRRAGAIVEALLSFSQRGDYVLQKTDVNKTIQRALEIISHQLQQGNVSIVLDLADGLPPVSASAPHLETAWINLLLNAKDAVEGRSDGEIRVDTARSEDGQWVRVCVSDNGRGIAPGHLDRIFDPFFTTKQPSEGTGLGLFICHSVVTKHRGRIEVESHLGKGSTFWVSLPAAG